MRSEFDKWFWSECDELNKDTSFAYSLAERAWDYKQRNIEDVQAMFVEQARTASNQQAKIDELTKHSIDLGQRYNEQVQRIKDLECWNDKLQKRVNKTLKMVEPLLVCEMYAHEALKLEQVLRGSEE